MSEQVTTKTFIKCKELKNSQYTGLTLHESVGGELPTGTLYFLQSLEDEDLSIDELSIELIMNQEYSISMKGFCDSATNFSGANQWELTFVPKDFYQTPNTRKHSGIKSLIHNLNPFNVIDSYNSDCNLDGIDLYQNGITDYKYLTKYLLSAAKDQLFAYRFDKLCFIDLNQVPTREINIQSIQRSLSKTIERSKFWTMEVNLSNDSKNDIVNYHYNNSIGSVPKDFKTAVRNYLNNSSLIQAMPGKITKDFPDYMNLRAGDLVTLTGNATDDSSITKGNYLVMDNTLELLPSQIKQTLVLVNYDSN